MPKGRFSQLTSWSFSVYQSYLKCPFSVCLDKIQRVRIQEEEQPHLVHGNKVHDAAAVCISGPKTVKPPKLTTPMKGREPLVTDLSIVKGIIAEARKLKGRTEQEWAFDRAWNQVDWRDWDHAWLRIKTDLCADTIEPPTVTITDWKTGKVHPEHTQQRSLYALGGLQLVQIGALAGGDKKVALTAQHVYLDTGQSATENFTMKHLAPLKREWTARTKQMLADTVFVTKPGQACRWCKYNAKRGGPCRDGV